MNKVKKILLVHNYYQISGGEDMVVFNEKKLLEDRGVKVVLYCRDNSELKKFSILKKVVFPIILIFNTKTYKDIKRIIEVEQIDIVHVHNTLALISPSVYYAALKSGVPVIQTVHNFRLLCPGATFYRNGHICEDCVQHGLLCAVKHGCYRGSRLLTLACVAGAWLHRCLRIYQRLNYICLSDFNKSKLLGFNQICSSQIFIKPNFTDDLKMGIIPYYQRKRRFIFAGRLDKLKGVVVLLSAWKQMGTYAPQLIICGTGPLEGWCREYIEINHLDNVCLMGSIPNDQTKKMIADSLALILPTQWYEGFPMVIVEAYSVGTPIIGSDLGNVGDIIEEGVTGWKFQADSPESLIKAVKSVKEISTVVYQKYTELYTPECNYKMLMSIYETIFNRRKNSKIYDE